MKEERHKKEAVCIPFSFSIDAPHTRETLHGGHSRLIILAPIVSAVAACLLVCGSKTPLNVAEAEVVMAGHGHRFEDNVLPGSLPAVGVSR